MMNKEALNMDVRQRRESLGFYITQASKLYGTQDSNAKISVSEFVNDVKFKYSVPLIALDFIDAMTGSELLQDLHNFHLSDNILTRFNIEDPTFLALKK